MLSREEQQRLIDIERRLRAAEPDLARSLSEGPRGRTLRQRAIALVATLAFRKPPPRA